LDSALEAARRCGARVQPVDIPDLHRAPGVMLCTIGPEAAEVHRSLLRQRAGLLPDDVRLRLEVGAFIPAVDYLRAQQLRAHLRRQVDAALDGVDVVLLPTLPARAPRRDAVSASAGAGMAAPRAAMSRFTALANLTGHPALTLPWAHDPDGAGIGVQLIGPWSSEEALLRIAAWLERARES
jgi:aspartyl-tRNA(Asn)/glutamyl-tRNA(Gln) amidotransferase subunit A